MTIYIEMENSPAIMDKVMYITGFFVGSKSSEVKSIVFGATTQPPAKLVK